MRLYVILVTFLLLVPTFATRGQADITAIKAGKILTMSGDPIKNGIILVEDGRIAGIGTEIEIPEDASIIDASQKVVMPGLVDASAVPPVRGGTPRPARRPAAGSPPRASSRAARPG